MDHLSKILSDYHFWPVLEDMAILAGFMIVYIWALYRATCNAVITEE